jgi:hypothetical protein
MDNLQPPLHLQPGVSRWLAGFVAGTHGIAAIVVLLMPALAWWGKALLLGLVAISLRHFWRLHIARTHPDAIHEATFYTLDNWRIQTGTGGKFAALSDSSFIHTWLCVLNLRSQAGKLYTLVLLPDSVPQDVLRQLRVRLRFAK